MVSQIRKRNSAIKEVLPTIPNKIYFSIGEVSKLCRLKPHVLRYWEQEFSSLRPIKRRGNRRYYRKEDILLVRQLKDLLYVKGYTIDGAKQQLSSLVAVEKKKSVKSEKKISEQQVCEKKSDRGRIHQAILALEELVKDLESQESFA